MCTQVWWGNQKERACLEDQVCMRVKDKKVNFILEQTIKAQRGSRNIALLFLWWAANGMP
jgi:hypothetical protein